MLRVQRLYGENMAMLGYSYKTFALETRAGEAAPIVHIARLSEPDTEFHDTDYLGLWRKILNGVAAAGFQLLSDGTIQEGTNFVGGAGARDGLSGVAAVSGDFLARASEAFLIDDRPYGGLTIPALGPFPLVQGVSFGDFEGGTVSSTSSSAHGAIAHELAHTFGLPHDFRNDANFNGNLLGNGLRGFRGFFHPDLYGEDDVRLSSASALQLNASRFFNETQPDSVAPRAQITSPGTEVPEGGVLRVHVMVTDDVELATVVLVRNGNVVGETPLTGRAVDTAITTYDFAPGTVDQWELIAFDAAGNRASSSPVAIFVATGFNHAAVPDISIGTRQLAVGQEVLIQGGRTSDPDGPRSALKVEWRHLRLDANGRAGRSGARQ